MALTGNQIGILHGDVQKTAFQTQGKPLFTAPSTFGRNSDVTSILACEVDNETLDDGWMLLKPTWVNP
jgi:hypothetical protein